MYVVVQLYHSESAEVKDNQVNFIFFINNGQDCSESIVQSISFHNELSIKNIITKNESRGECFFERVESITIGGVELPGSVLLGEVC